MTIHDISKLLKEAKVPIPTATIIGGQTDRGKVVFLVVIDSSKYLKSKCWQAKGVVVEEAGIPVPIILIKSDTSFYEVYINLQKKKDLEAPRQLVLIAFDSHYNFVFSKDLSDFLPYYNQILNVEMNKTWSDAEFEIAKRRIMEKFSLEELWQA